MKAPVLEGLLNLLFPPKCPFCGRVLERDGLLCPACEGELRFLSGAAGETAVELTRGCVSAVAYTARAKEGIWAFKFRGKSARGAAFGRLIARTLQEREVSADLVSWPPLSPKRLRRRGYDQAEVLARAVGEQLGLPVVRTLCKAERPAQSGLTGRAERRANVLGAYTAACPEAVRGKRVLLIDDVVTTGATLSECAAVLRLAGAAEVSCATLAKAGE